MIDTWKIRLITPPCNYKCEECYIACLALSHFIFENKENINHEGPNTSTNPSRVFPMLIINNTGGSATEIRTSKVESLAIKADAELLIS